MIQGTIHSINVSNGGVPKSARASARITRDGVEGDRQRNLKHHGGPDRAVCIYSLERIEALRAEGHPIEPGSIGENLTITGWDWSMVGTGATIRIGGVTLEVTVPAFPCQTIAASFAHGDSVRVSEKVHPGWSRWYCRVLVEGVVHEGAACTIGTSRAARPGPRA
jgi:MOSC domain-containing protein YiiM